MITSNSNPKIKEIKKLHQRKYRLLSGTYLVEGEHLVEEARLAGVLLKAYTTNANLEGELLSEQVMKYLTEAKGSIRQIGICKTVLKNSLSNQILILDNVQDPGNMGALMRSARAFNFNTIFISKNSVDIYNPKVIRSSQGAIFKLNFIFGETTDFINKLKQENYDVFGTDVNNGQSLKTVSTKRKFAFILGNEGSGITKEVKQLGLSNIYINMSKTESLNVSVAGSIIMYELNKNEEV